MVRGNAAFARKCSFARSSFRGCPLLGELRATILRAGESAVGARDAAALRKSPTEGLLARIEREQVRGSLFS